MQTDHKKKTITTLRQAEGMLKKVVQMVENDIYCIDLLQQSLATIGFIKSANKLMLENHLNCCFKDGMQKGSSKKQKQLIDEVVRVVGKN